MADPGSGLKALSLGSSRRNSAFSRSSGSSAELNEFNLDDEEALKWAALERLSTFDRLRTSVIKNELGGPHADAQQLEHVDLRHIDGYTRQQIINTFFKGSTEEDNEMFLKKLRARIDRVGITLPTVEVRYENLEVEVDTRLGARALPTLKNVARNWIEGAFEYIGISLAEKRRVKILKNVNGIVKPGRMTLLLGPPGAGKTTLLLGLAGKLDSNLKVSGDITYNGLKLNEFVPEKSSAYISQHDLHIGEMTVRETLDYSARFQGVGTRFELLSELLKREKELHIQPDTAVDAFMKATSIEGVESSLATDYTMKILGLDICADIFVGDAMRRGISGGQKKRVTTGEMIVGPTRTLFMDEISTGLDSSTTFQIVKCLRQFVHVMDATILMSLLQPAPETYDLFDDILLLCEGQVVYNGPRENILEFFEACGFRCPERKGVADFLQEVTSRKDQQQYHYDRGQPYQFVPVTYFANYFKKFSVGEKMTEELSVPFDKSKNHSAALSFQKYSVSNLELLKANFDKELLWMKRNSFLFIFKACQIAIVGLIAMSVFFRTQMKRSSYGDAQLYDSALFFGITMMMFNGFTELSLTVGRLPNFYKQRDLLFYPPWAWAIPGILLRVPVSIFEALIYTVLTYYTTGFAPEAERFFRQFFSYCLLHQMSSSVFRLIAGVCRSMVVANTGGSLTLLIIFCMGGFLLPRNDVKKWWLWGYWVSPLSYAENGIAVNEFLAPEWQKNVSDSTHTLGVQFLINTGNFPYGYWYWISVAAMIGWTVLFNVLFIFSLSLKPFGSITPVISLESMAEEEEGRVTEGGEVRAIAADPMPRSLSGATTPGRSPRKSLSFKKGRDSFEGSPRKSMAHSIEGGDGAPAGFPRKSSSTMNRESLEIFAKSQGKRGMILPFQPLALSFNDVCYSVDMPVEMKQQGALDDKLQLLRRVTGAFRPGVLTALVGVSGAGKTTLMDVLAGRKTGGYIEGDIRISGFPKKQETFARVSGYCEQNDIHSPQVTVHESLVYSAWLRLPTDVHSDVKTQFVLEVMELVELTSLTDALVGLPGVTGLSTEQRKRLTIAVELVANPSIIFMDEPTSGLDARAAAIVMRTVRNTVDTGRTVVCTIHQPSIDIFEAFDELLLMKRGGQVSYAGPLGRQSHRLIEYFEAISGIPKIKDGYNPATWMLEVTSGAVEQRLGIDFAEHFLNSSLFERNKALVEQLSIPAPNAKDLKFPTQYSQPFFIQVRSCLWKQYWTYWRSPDYNNVRLTFTTVAAIVLGTMFWQLGQNVHTQTQLNSVLGAMYAAALFLGVNNTSTVMPVVATERTVFYRERGAGMYSAIPYAIAQVLVELPYCLLQTCIYGSITYSMIGLEWSVKNFFWYLFYTFCTLMYFTYYGMMAVSLTPNHGIAAIVASGFYSLFNLFSGFLVPKPSIPVWWIWYYYACPVAWSFYGIVITQFGHIDTIIDVRGKGNQTVQVYLDDTFGLKTSFIPVVAVMNILFPVLFAAVFGFAIKFLNFQNR